MAKNSFDTAVSDFGHALGILIRRVRAAATANELSMTEASVLGRLEREGSATTAELARAEGVKPQSMGTTVAVLEEMGLVERSPHATDGRQMMISLTAKGVALRKNVRSAKHGWLAQHIAQLDKHEQETLFAAGEIIRRLVEKSQVQK
jgi:DNA-binding MarR family transcriptional regulator